MLIINKADYVFISNSLHHFITKMMVKLQDTWDTCETLTILIDAAELVPAGQNPKLLNYVLNTL